MARPKPWIGRIPQIIKLFEDCEAAYFTRREVEEFFQIGRSAAHELMQVVGATPGKPPHFEGRCSRANILRYLKHGPEGAAFEQERARKERLAKTLTAAAHDQQLRSIKLPVERGQEWLLKDLANVSIAASEHGGGTMLVVFSDARDLLGQLYKLVQAAGAEWEEFQALCSPLVSKAIGDNADGLQDREEPVTEERAS